MTTNFRVKIGEIGLLTYIRRLSIRKRIDIIIIIIIMKADTNNHIKGLIYRNSDLKQFHVNNLATPCKNLVNFRPVTPEFKMVKGVHPSSIYSLVTFAWRQLC